MPKRSAAASRGQPAPASAPAPADSRPGRGRIRETYTDADGNTVTREYWEHRPKRDPHPLGRFIMGGCWAMRQLACYGRAELHDGDGWIIFYLMGACEFGNRVTVTPTAVAKALGLQRETVSRAFARFRRAGILVRDPSEPATVRHPWHLSPRAFAKGAPGMIDAFVTRLATEEQRALAAAHHYGAEGAGAPDSVTIRSRHRPAA